MTSPEATRMSASSKPSWKKPFLKEDDSTPMPTIAPPTVMVRSSGITSGITPTLRVSATKVSNVAEASMSHHISATLTSRTCTSSLKSKRALDSNRPPIWLGRNVFEAVFLNMRKGPGTFAASLAAFTRAAYSSLKAFPAGPTGGPFTALSTLQTAPTSGSTSTPHKGDLPLYSAKAPQTPVAESVGAARPSMTIGSKGQTIVRANAPLL
mmetsp:Transcript_31175/g.72655  ORF Transcript_31175/g.72655 Transcript_31175/m.72655 type:complete len:210 (+) Transcript_31175:1036-1665(+)